MCSTLFTFTLNVIFCSEQSKSAHCLLTIIYITHHFPQPIISNYPGCWCSENREVTVNTNNSGYCFSSFSRFLMRLIKRACISPPPPPSLFPFWVVSLWFKFFTFYISLSCFSRVVPFSLPITISVEVGQPEDQTTSMDTTHHLHCNPDVCCRTIICRVLRITWHSLYNEHKRGTRKKYCLFVIDHKYPVHF